MNWLIEWGVKKWIIGAVNKALDAYWVNIDRARAVVAVYAGKAKALLDFLESLDKKLEDGKITEEEADAIVYEATALAKSIVA